MSAKPEILYTCPKCDTAGFTVAGLHSHQCRAKPDRARLTMVEIAYAKPSTPPKGGAS